MPDMPEQKSYETEKLCPVCAKTPKLVCKFETIFAGPNRTRHLECFVCGYQVQDVVNMRGQVIFQK